MAANAGTRLQEKNKTRSPAPSDHSQALTSRCPLSVSLLCISSPGTFRTLHLTPGAFRGTLLQALLELIAEHPEDCARCEKRLFVHRVILRTIFLPRQARDKHREKWRKERRFVQAALHLARLPAAPPHARTLGAARARRSDHRCGTSPCFGASLILKTISLPRQ
jgi:hypothetical protein